LLLQRDKLVTVIFYIHPASDTSDADDNLHDTYTEHVIFSFKSKQFFRPPPRLACLASVEHPVRPPSGPRPAPVWPPLGTPTGPRMALCVALCGPLFGSSVQPRL
jgi:hypothetical protein